MHMLPNGFSIVLCTHNGLNKLEPTLQHLAKLSVPANYSVELIIVDNASTDDTAGFAQSTWKNAGVPYPLIIIDENRPGKGYAVEAGYDKAKYSYILTVDDDNWLKNDYLLRSVELMESDPAIGILQAKSEGVYEVPPPDWVNNFLPYFIIGGPRNKNGLYPKNNFYVWGAGMVIKNADWKYVRSKGFSFISSKLSGKAAGEDNETAIALLMLGRKIYYSDTLQYKHYMPAERIDWNKLEQNFDTYGYVLYYMFLYMLVLESFHKGYTITTGIIKIKFLLFALKKLKGHPLKIYYRRIVHNEKSIYNLQMRQNFSFMRWANTLLKSAIKDTEHIRSWMYPLLKENSTNFFVPLMNA